MIQTPPEAAEALEAVTVIQADRDAAIEHYVRKGFPTREQAAKMINSWPADAHVLQMLARHRIAHTRAQPSRGMPDVMPGHWETADGRDMAIEYAGVTRESLTKGDMCDLVLANGVFLASRYDFDLIVWQTAAKERIRWLSVQLALAQPAIQGERERG